VPGGQARPGPTERAERPVTDAAGRPLAARGRIPGAAVAVLRGLHLAKRGVAHARPLRMAVRAGLLVPLRVAVGRQTRHAEARPRVEPALVSSTAAAGPSAMTTPATEVPRPAAPAGVLGPRRADPSAARPGRRRQGRPVTVPGLRRVGSAAARGRPRTMTCVVAPGLRRAADPAGRALRQVAASAARPGLRPTGHVGLRATDAIAGYPRVTTGPLHRVTEPVGRSARTDPRGGT
jgi:hypothetical protein